MDLFFVLSGFLVGRIIFREYARTGRFEARRFLTRRIFKLWPMFYLFLFVEAMFGDDPWQQFLFQNLFHLQNYLSHAHPHLWSLAVEEHFYLAAALVLPLLMVRGWTARRFTVLLLCVMAASPVLRVIGYLSGVDPIALWLQTQYRIDALCCGVLLAVLSVYNPMLWDRLVGLKPVWLLVTAAGVVWLILVPVTSPLGVTAGFSVSYLASAAFMLLLHRASWVNRSHKILRPVAVLGVFSYGIYLWHLAVGTATENALSRFVPDRAVQMLLGYVALTVFAIVITRLIEWPSLRVRERLFPARVRASSDAPRPSSSPTHQIETLTPGEVDPAELPPESPPPQGGLGARRTKSST